LATADVVVVAHPLQVGIFLLSLFGLRLPTALLRRRRPRHALLLACRSGRFLPGLLGLLSGVALFHDPLLSFSLRLPHDRFVVVLL
jgi:hypothetical protein